MVCMHKQYLLHCQKHYNVLSTIVLKCVVIIVITSTPSNNNTCCQADEHVVSKGLEDNAQERTALRNKPGPVGKTVEFGMFFYWL